MFTNSINIMRFIKLVLALSPFALALGCVESHRDRVVYSPARVYGPAGVAVSPTSDRQVARVYPGATTVIIPTPAPSATVSSADVETANIVRRIFEADRGLAQAARNARISVLNGQITMTGSVATRRDRVAVRNAMRSTPGVSRVEDLLRVEHP